MKTPNSYVLSFREFFQPLRKHNLKLLLAKLQLSAIKINFLGNLSHFLSEAPMLQKPLCWPRLQYPKTSNDCDLYWVVAFPAIGSSSSHWKKKFGPSTFLSKGAKFEFMPKMENTVCALLANLSAEPVPAFPD